MTLNFSRQMSPPFLFPPIYFTDEITQFPSIPLLRKYLFHHLFSAVGLRTRVTKPKGSSENTTEPSRRTRSVQAAHLRPTHPSLKPGRRTFSSDQFHPERDERLP